MEPRRSALDERSDPTPRRRALQWPEATWRRIVGRARAGRSLKPKAWPDGARCAVAISFDADHETIPLRDADESPMRISQGQYGNRQAMPRIRKLLEREAVPASFFYPAVSALLHPEEVRATADDGHEIGIHSWIHEANTTLPREAERDLTFRAAETLGRIAGRNPVGMRTASWDFSVNTLDIVRELGLLYDSSLMADDDPYELVDAENRPGSSSCRRNGSATMRCTTTSSASPRCGHTRHHRRWRRSSPPSSMAPGTRAGCSC